MVYEEIFVINEETKTILNYLTIVEYPNSSLISMLSGPTADGGKNHDSNMFEETGFRSQEVFTQEKYTYLFYQGLLLLEYLYKSGISHGQINAATLRISDNYTFSLSDLPISTCLPGFKDLTE